MVNKLRAAIAGLDHWYIGLGELDAASRSSRVEVVALAHRDEQKAEETARRYRVAEWTTDYASVVARPDVDIVVTAGYTSENRALCEAAAAHGKHIVSVKPIAMTVSDAEAIARAAHAAGVHFFSLESAWRIMPVYRRIQQWVGEGRIGSVISAYTLLRSPLPMQPWPGERGKTWWLDPTRAPAGGWLDHAIYHVDFLRWLLNDEVTRIGGDIGNLKYSDPVFEDYGVANLTFGQGARATLDVTWTGPAGGTIAQSHIVGTEGQIVYDGTLTGKLAVSGKFDLGGWLLTAAPTSGPSFIGLPSGLEHLAEVIQEGGSPAASVDDAVRNLKTCLAFYPAAREGRVAQLE